MQIYFALKERKQTYLQRDIYSKFTSYNSKMREQKNKDQKPTTKLGLQSTLLAINTNMIESPGHEKRKDYLICSYFWVLS